MILLFLSAPLWGGVLYECFFIVRVFDAKWLLMEYWRRLKNKKAGHKTLPELR